MTKSIVFLIAVLLLAGFLFSVAMLRIRTQWPKKVKMQMLEAPQRDLALEFNSFLASNPSEDLNRLVSDLNWIIKNDYQRDIRVKRIIHQDLKSLVDMNKLREQLGRNDDQTSLAYRQAVATIAERTSKLRYTKDENIRDQILILGDMIKGNDR